MKPKERSKAIYSATKSEPVEDVAYAFHISRQRVHQIIKKERWKARHNKA